MTKIKEFNTGVVELVFVPIGKEDHFRYFKATKRIGLIGDYIFGQKLIKLDEAHEYELIGIQPEISEEKAKELVGIMKDNTGNHYYDFIYQRYMMNLSSKESLNSAIKASGIEVKENEVVLILKKLK